MFRPVSIPALLVGLVGSVVACKADLTLPSQALPKFITIQSGNRQTGEVGTPLSDSLVVLVSDGTGRPVQEAVVHFVPQPLASDGQLIPDSAWTDAEGRASTRWVLGTHAGPLQAVAQVRAARGGEGPTVAFAATAMAGPAAIVRAVRGDSQAASVGALLTDSLIVLVTDQFGNPLPAQAVGWNTADGGVVSNTTTSTNAAGRAGVAWRLGERAGPQLTQATIAGLSGSPVGFGATALPGPATALLRVFGDSQVAPVHTPLVDSVVVELVDEYGNGVSGRGINWVVTAGGGSVSPATGTTDASGRAFCHWTLGAGPGSQMVSAFVGGLTPAAFTAIAISQSPAMLQAFSSTTLVGQAGQPVSPPPSVRALDGFGNPVPGVAVTFAVRNAGGQVSSQTTQGSVVNVATNGSGVAGLVAWTLPNLVGTDTVEARAVGPTGPLTGSPVLFTAFGLPGPAARLAFLAEPGTTTAGTPISPPVTVAVQDLNGNLATSYSGTVTLALGRSPPGGTLTGTTAAGVTGGIATFGGVILPIAGTGYTLTATAQPPVTSATSDSFAVLPGSAGRLAIVTQPSDTVASGVRFPRQPVVRLEDGLGNLVRQSNVAITVTIATGDGLLAGTRTVATTNGVATFTDLSLSGLAGPRTLLFSAPGLLTTSSTPVRVVAGSAATLGLAAGGGQTANVGTTVAVAPAVRVTDLAGNPVAGVTVGFAVTGGGGSLTGPTAVTNSLGIATVGSWRLGPTKGTNTLTATASGLTGSPVSISATGRFAVSVVRGGARFSCGITTAGTPYCWGRNNNGQLGNGGTTDQLSPVLVAGGLLFQAVGLGNAYACGLTAAGAAYCWGVNANGQLGDGTTTNRLTPVAVAGGYAFASIAGGSAHTCALTAAGAAYCWGQNNRGQLGDGTTTARSTPVAVAGGIAFSGLALGTQFSCGLATSGRIYCWGLNGTGQLGDGTTTNRLTPTVVAGTGWTAVAAGDVFACGLSAGGAASCWGLNDKGQLGDGGNTNRSAPAPVSGGLSFARLDAGGTHACGVSLSGASYCWGLNADGELGDGTTTDRPVPTAVLGGTLFSTVSAGGLHTLALTADGRAFGWGADANGQLGTGTKTDKLAPVAVIEP